jgi:hypothetical protein
MKFILRFSMLCLLACSSIVSSAQNEEIDEPVYEIKTLLNGRGVHSSGGYGAIGNKFTTIDGHYANLVEIYGGWYINHKFLLGIEGAALTNNIPVKEEFNTMPGYNTSLQYGQFGIMTEYTLWSDRAIHLSFHVTNGAGFTVQYLRTSSWDDDEYWEEFRDIPHDSNWFFVTEPGVKVEMNVLRWLRFSPGVSYRATFGSNAKGLEDSALSGISLNATLKFGKF